MGAGLFLRERFAVLKTIKEFSQVAVWRRCGFSTRPVLCQAPILGLIGSPTLQVCLAAWAIFIIWFATRKESEVMAMSAVAGAYYASYVPLIHAPSETNIWFTFAQHGVGDNGHCVYGPQSLGESVFLALITTYAGFIFWRFQTPCRAKGSCAGCPVPWTVLVGIYRSWISSRRSNDADQTFNFRKLKQWCCFAPRVHRVTRWINCGIVIGFCLPYSAPSTGSLPIGQEMAPKGKLFADLLLAKSTVLMTLGV